MTKMKGNLNKNTRGENFLSPMNGKSFTRPEKIRSPPPIRRRGIAGDYCLQLSINWVLIASCSASNASTCTRKAEHKKLAHLLYILLFPGEKIFYGKQIYALVFPDQIL